MNAIPQEAIETPEQAARRLPAQALREGYTPEALHCYRDDAGQPVYYRIRCRHPDGRKWIRPMRWDGSRYVIDEPATAGGKPLYRLPELLAAHTDTPVIIVEGEWCADHAARIGLTATTSGSASSARATDWLPLRGRQCVIWPDHDAPGQQYADAVTAILTGMGCAVERIDVMALGLPEGGDIVDWLAVHPEMTAADVLALARVAEAAPTDTTPAPEPLRRPLPAAPDYPLSALGELLGSAAQRIHDVVQAPAGLCGQSILAAASLAVQAQANIAISGNAEPLSLWHVSIGASGERKSAVDAWALRAHSAYEREQAQAYRDELTAYEQELGIYEAARRRAEKAKDTAAIRAAMDELGPPPQPPLLPWLLVSEPTMEGVHKLYQHGRPTLGLFNDDAGDFIGGHAMNRDNRAKSAAGLSKLWDSGQFDRIRAGDGAGKFYGRRLALHLMIQPVIAETVLGDDVLTGQGFLARCLLSWPASTIGTRTYQDVDLSRDAVLGRYWHRMRELLTMTYPLCEGTRNELAPRALTLEPEAMAYWVQIKNAIEAAMLGTYAGIHAWASKGGSQVARIAGVLTLAEDLHAGVITRETVERAATLVLYHLDEAARIVGTASVPAHVRHAELLRDWCWQTGRTRLYSTDAMHSGPGVIRTQETFTAAVESLESTGWAVPIEGGAVIDGRRRARVWTIRPEAEA